MLLYFPFSSISTQCSVSKWFGSPSFQRHLPADVPLTQRMLSVNQLHVWDPSTLFKPMNQRVFFCFLVKLWTKCHSFSVSIETSKPFPWSLHFFLAVLQSSFSSSKEYLEQTIIKVYGEPTDVIEKRQTRKKLYFYLCFNCIYHSRIIWSYTDGELNKTPRHTKVFCICNGATGIGWTRLWISKVRSLHKSNWNTWGVASTFPSPSVPCLMT